MRKFGLVAALLLVWGATAQAQGMGESTGAGSVAGAATSGGARGISMPKLESFPGNVSAPQTSSVDPAQAPMPPQGAPILSPAVRKQMENDLALMNAAYNGETWNVRAALAKGARINERDYQYGLTPLMWAAIRGHVGTIRHLIARGAKVNAQSKTGIPILMAQGRSVDQTTSVTEQQVNFIRYTTYVIARRGGVTALMLAAANGWNLAARELLKHGADSNIATPDGDTALQAAAFSGSVPLVQALLDKGAKVNAVDALNNSALLNAAMDGHTPVARLLLTRGARASLVSRHTGTTAAALARYRGYESLARLLESAAKKEKPIAVPASAKLPLPARNDVRVLN